jgi:hypothetical protein
MSKNRIVQCTVINNTTYTLTYLGDAYEQGASGDSHGVWIDSPVSSIPSGGISTVAFSVERDGSFSTAGSTGWVAYALNNSQGQIVFMFNNPNTYEGIGSASNCWFYTVIQGAPDTGLGVGLPVGSPLNVYVSISGFTIDVTDPTNQDTMDVTVTLDTTVPPPSQSN